MAPPRRRFSSILALSAATTTALLLLGGGDRFRCLRRIVPSAAASSVAGTETLLGIVGRDFVLLAADSSVSQSIALTASNLDKIAHLVDPFPDYDDDNDHRPNGYDDENENENENERQQQAILAAAAGDAADSDRLLGYLKAIGSLEEYTNDGPFSCDVVRRSLDDDYDYDDDEEEEEGRTTTTTTEASPSPPPLDDHHHRHRPRRRRRQHGPGGLDVLAMAHLTRRCIWERLRSQTPYRVCLLVAGMMPDDDDEHEHEKKNVEPAVAFLSKGVQKQIRRAGGGNHDDDDDYDASSVQRAAATATKAADQPDEYDDHDDDDGASAAPPRRCRYAPALYWLDEYGSLQSIDYGAHGHGSSFLLSVLDQRYRPDLTKAEALDLVRDCFEELRNRYVINSPEPPCVKCVDATGITVLPAASMSRRPPS